METKGTETLTNITISEEISKSSVPPKKKNTFLKILQDYRPILLFLPLILMIAADDTTLIVNEVLILVEFNLESNMTAFGALLGVSQVVKAISILVFGFMADRFQRKKLLIISALGWAICDIVIGFSTTFWMLFLFRVLATTCAGAASSVTLSLVSDLFSSEDRGLSFSIWTAISTIGVGVGAGLATAFNQIEYSFDVDVTDLAERIQGLRASNPANLVTISWQAPFLAFGFIGLACIVLALFLKEPKRAAKEKILSEVLSHEEIDYGKVYNIKLTDLKFVWERKTNFFLIINFLDTILTGLILGSIVVWITVELGFNLSSPANWGYLLCLMVPLGLLTVWGMFYWPKRGDKIVKRGDPTGRVKTAIFAGFAHLPFLIIGFFFIPDAINLTFFKGAIQATPTTFAVGLIIMGLILGAGLSLEMAVGPCHYSSMIDVNLPEHRSTMIAAAAFIDSFGRAIGSYVGLAIADYYQNTIASPKPISDAIIFSVLTFGIGSGLMWLPIYKFARKDITSVNTIMETRKNEMEQLLLNKNLQPSANQEIQSISSNNEKISERNPYKTEK